MVCRDAECTVEGEPGHHLGVHVVRGVGAHLPDSGVGLAPPARDGVGEAGDGAPGLGVQPVPRLGKQPGSVDHPAVPAELVLVSCSVTDPDGLFSEDVMEIHIESPAYSGRQLAVSVRIDPQ